MRKKECIAMLLAGGQGSRLGGLTRNTAKPAVSFGGKFRIIDFSLSNCAHSHIDTIGVLTQYKPFFLNSYIGMGTAWDLDNPFGGVHVLPPYTGENQGSWYNGTANAIYQNMDFINFYDPDCVLIISGDHIYKMDYSLMLKFHKEKNSEVTISTIEVPLKEASRFGIMTADSDNRIVRFAEKPSKPESNLASMGVYIFNWSVLKNALIEDEANPNSDKDFGKNVIPMLLHQGRKLYSYKFDGYWRDVGTIESYYNANMEILYSETLLNLHERTSRIYSNEEILTPQYIGPNAEIVQSIISNGCTILGQVKQSILASGVYIGENTIIEDSILLPNSKVDHRAKVCKTILGENAKILSDSLIGTMSNEDTPQESITVVEDHSVIPEGSIIEAGRNIPRDN